MSLFSKIVVACDFSPDADQALKQAVVLAHVFKSKVFIVHVLEKNPDDPIWEILKLPLDVEIKIQNRILAKIRELFPRERLPLDYQIAVVEGDVPLVLTDYSREKGADLLMVGTHGGTGLAHALLGDNTERIAARANFPVWICRPPIMEGVGEILAPLDFSEGNRIAVEWADALAAGFEASLTLMHVATMPSLAVLFGEEDPLAVEEAKKVLCEKAESNLKLWLEKLKAPEADYLLNEGVAAEEIVKTAKARKAGLIVMATHGHGSAKKPHLGKLSTHLVRYAPCSVLMIPPHDR
ncbi:MAG: universal stress protein [Deltaproteobacteria bacterium]|nr:universal stress protein [Deltaproteobacteria bacterium]